MGAGPERKWGCGQAADRRGSRRDLQGDLNRKRFKEAGLKDAYIDTEGNVMGLRKGGGGPKLVVSAHMDTVFAEGTDVKVKEIDGRFHAPGIADDTRGLVALLSVIATMNANDVRTVGDVLFMATVGEEELGNLRGVKALFRDHKDIDGFISIDGTAIDRVTNTAAGSHRYEVVFKGPGGTLSVTSACRARSRRWAVRWRRSPTSRRQRCRRRPLP